VFSYADGEEVTGGGRRAATRAFTYCDAAGCL
jgi:hypothetical protein